MTESGTTYGRVPKLVHDHSYSVPMVLCENAPRHTTKVINRRCLFRWNGPTSGESTCQRRGSQKLSSEGPEHVHQGIQRPVQDRTHPGGEELRLLSRTWQVQTLYVQDGTLNGSSTRSDLTNYLAAVRG